MAVGIGSDPVEDYGRAMQAGSTDGIDPSVVMAKYGDPGNLASAYAQATGMDPQQAFNKLMAALTGSNPSYKPDAAAKNKQPGTYDKLTQQAAKNLGVGSGLTDYTDPDAISAAGLQGLQKSYQSTAPQPGQAMGGLPNFAGKRKPQSFPFPSISGNQGQGYADGGYVDNGGGGAGNGAGYDSTGLGLDPLSSFLIGAGASGLASGALNVGQALGAGVQGGLQFSQRNAQLGMENRKLKLAEQSAPIQRELAQAQTEDFKSQGQLRALQGKQLELDMKTQQAMQPMISAFLGDVSGQATQAAQANGGQFNPAMPSVKLGDQVVAPADVKASLPPPTSNGSYQIRTAQYDPQTQSFVTRNPDGSAGEAWNPMRALQVGSLMMTTPRYKDLGGHMVALAEQAFKTGLVPTLDGKGMVRLQGWDDAQAQTAFREARAKFIGQDQPKLAQENANRRGQISLEKDLDAQNTRERIGLETGKDIATADNQAKNRFTTVRGADGREQIVPDFYARGMYEQNLRNANSPPPQPSAPPTQGAFNVGGAGGALPAQPSQAQVQPASAPAQAPAPPAQSAPGQVNYPAGLEKGLAPDETAVVEHFAKDTLPALASMRNNAEKGQGEIRSMQGVIDQISTGPLEKHILPLQQSVSNLFGLFGQKPPEDFASKIANKELFAKDGTRLGFELAKTLGSREAQMIVQQAIAANPNLLNSQEGNKRLLSLFYQAYQRDIDRGKYAADYYKDNRAGGGATLNEAAFEDAFNKAHPMKTYIGNAVGLQRDAVEKLKPGTRFIGIDGDIHERQ